MNQVVDLLSADKIDELWGLGFTVAKRLRDPYDLPKEAIPHGMVYQWNPQPGDLRLEDHVRRKSTGAKVEDNPVGGWSPVNHERHPGVFGPWGMRGPIEVGGLWLCERPEGADQQAKARQVQAAHQQVADWAERFGGAGISGGVKIGGVELGIGDIDVTRGIVFPDAKTIETNVRMPADMLPHMAEVFAERDRLYAELQVAWQADIGDPVLWHQELMQKYHEALAADPEALKGPTFNALLLPRAIESVRAKLKHPLMCTCGLMAGECKRAGCPNPKQEKSDE